MKIVKSVKIDTSKKRGAIRPPFPGAECTLEKYCTALLLYFYCTFYCTLYFRKF